VEKVGLKLKETVNRETHEKCVQKTTLQEITDGARLKKYLKMFSVGKMQGQYLK